jgi:uncharacterized protein (TIGR02118 family)
VSGYRSAVIKLCYCLRRKPGMSREEFGRYWHDVHGPIGRRIPGLRRLVQVHATGDGGYDGIAELWFDDVEALEAARRSPQWAASTADEANFVDGASSVVTVGIERELPGR